MIATIVKPLGTGVLITWPWPFCVIFQIVYYKHNQNYNKILKSDWLSTALISALIGQLNRTVRVMPK